MMVLLISASKVYSQIYPTKYSYLDWFNLEQEAACQGAYFEPDRVGIDDKTPLNEAVTNIEATEFNYNFAQDTIEFNNGVKAQISSTQIEAQSGSLNRKQNTAEFQDSIRLRDKGTLLLGSKLELDLNQAEAKLDDAEYVLHDGRVHGKAKFLQRNIDKTITLKSATYSSCRPGGNAWYLQSNLIKLNPASGFGSATNVVLRIKDVPIFYLPYISFPIDKRRSSGFLAPSISSSDDYGFSLRTPYYLNLAPNFDATIYPTYMEKNGLLLENELRFLQQNGNGQIWLGAIDDQNRKRINQSLYQTNRWAYQVKYDYRYHNLRAGLNVSKLSDPYYLKDLPSNLGAQDTTFITNRIYLEHNASKLSSKLNLIKYEAATISNITPYNKLPHLSFNLADLLKLDLVHFQRNLKSGYFVDQKNNNHLWLDERIKGLARAQGQRSHLQLDLNHRFDFSSVYIKPQISILHTNYHLDLDAKGRANLAAQGKTFAANIDRSLMVSQLEAGFKFDLSSNKTLMPKIMAIYVPLKDQTNIPVFDSDLKNASYANLWQFNRFSGLDRIGDNQQISMGLELNSKNNNGSTVQTIKAGRAHYLNTQKVQLPGLDYQTLPSANWRNSPFIAEYWRQINSKWSLFGRLNWQEEDRTTKLAQIGFNYHDAGRKIFNVNYSYKNNDVTQRSDNGLWQMRQDYVDPVTGEIIKNYYQTNALNISSVLPLNHNFNFLLHLNYDYNKRRTEEYFAGIGYKTCCLDIKLINRYWLDDDDSSLSNELNRKSKSGVFLQLNLTGLGNLTGGDISNLLHNKIQGFKEHE